MGKYKSKRMKKKLANNQRNDKNSTEDYRGPSFKDIIRENQDLESYYKKQNLCLNETEWNVMLEKMKSNLPTGFRITGSLKGQAELLLRIVENTLFNNLSEEDKRKCQPYCLPWYPRRLGWQIQITRNDIRRSEAYFRLHNFLITETEVGYISRQEVVSMIPPLLMDIQPHHKVLDMCAAPGSKTAQMVEILHWGSESDIPDGVVVANDVDNDRCYKLVHQVKRLNSPCFIVTNHDAGNMPNFFLSNSDDSKYIMKFDRILCDVPCTGDGTLRKNPDIWTKWNTANGNNLHGVQIRILKRGLEMLSIGGRLVYSTCSLNPIENEAVIHRLLVEANDSVEIVDVSSTLSGLKYSPGLTNWWPASKDLEFYDSFDEVPEKWRTVIRPNMFPPSKEDASKFHFERCIRILPHHQNTGGFFVTVLKKVKLLPWESQVSSIENGSTTVENNRTFKHKSQLDKKANKRIKLGYREDPFVFFQGDDVMWQRIKEFYKMKNSDLLPQCFLTRCENEKKKNLYLTSCLVKDIIINNQHRIKLINSGVKVLSRCDNKYMGCSFRLTQEGLSSIEALIGTERRILVNKDDFIKILWRNDPANALNISDLAADCQERVTNTENGSCILELNHDNVPIKIVGWRGTNTIRAYITVNESVHYLRILGEDVSQFDKNKFKKVDETVQELKIAEITTGTEKDDLEIKNDL